MNFSSYFVLSSLVVLGVMSHAYVVHEQFYPAVVYLSTDKMCLAVMYNFAFALFLLFGKVLLKTFVGTLRDLEVEQLIDSGRGFLADTILFLVFYAPTIDNREVGTVYLIQYICCVIFMKVFHLTTQIRVTHMFEVGVPRLITNVKLVSLMCLLLSLDILALQYFYNVASRSSTFFTWILFEALTMSTIVVVSICKYSVHMVDLRLDNGWPAKSVCLFYIDLVHDVASMTLFLVFMLTFFVQNPSRLPIYMMADVIQVARKLAQRLRSFRRYRRISTNMEARFPDATDEEIEANEHCVICRDSLFDGSRAKKLACGHIFHIDCLRSWLVMQQVCPTCRAEIPPDAPLAGPSATTPAAQAVSPAVADAAGAAAAAAAAAPGAAPVAAAVAPAAASTSAAPAAAAPGASAPSAAAQIAGPAAQLAGPAVAAAFGIPAIKAASPTSAASSAAPAAMAFGFGDPAIFGSTLGALPPVHDIVESLKRAEDVAKFLRQQTEFWMEQVSMIEKNYTQQAPGTLGFSADTMGLLSAQRSTLLGTAGVFAPAAASAAASAAAPAPAAAAAVAAAPVAAAASPASSHSVAAASGIAAALHVVKSIEPSLERNASTIAHAGNSTDSIDGGLERNASTGSVQDSLADLRRAQREQWERKRTMSQTSDLAPDGEAASPSGAGAASPDSPSAPGNSSP